MREEASGIEHPRDTAIERDMRVAKSGPRKGRRPSQTFECRCALTNNIDDKVRGLVDRE